jgi:uroporphyrinogen decarboxylase
MRYRGAGNQDSMVDLPSIVNRVPSNIVLMGNIPTVEKLYLGKPDDFIRECTALMEKMRNVQNYIVTSSCELPLDTPQENVTAMMETIRRFR